MTARRAPKYVAYYRVSTQKQGRSGLGLEAQREAVAAHIAGVSGSLVAEFTEVETGKRADRPELAKALAQCRVHNAVLIVAKLDRLARNVAFVSGLLETGCEFVAVDFPQANRFMIHMLAAVGEYEAKLISERTKAALAQAKRKGVQIGGYADNCAQIAHRGNKASIKIRKAASAQRARDIAPIISELKADGAMSLRQIANGLNQLGIPTARNGAWSAVQVMRVLSRAA
jgi:DNA invertase Pin-like site-specific DNA recombinase